MKCECKVESYYHLPGECEWEGTEAWVRNGEILTLCEDCTLPGDLKPPPTLARILQHLKDTPDRVWNIAGIDNASLALLDAEIIVRSLLKAEIQQITEIPKEELL